MSTRPVDTLAQPVDEVFISFVFPSLWRLLILPRSSSSMPSDGIAPSHFSKNDGPVWSATPPSTHMPVAEDGDDERELVQTCALNITKALLHLMGLSKPTASSTPVCCTLAELARLYQEAADVLLSSFLGPSFLGKDEFQQSIRDHLLSLWSSGSSHAGSNSTGETGSAAPHNAYHGPALEHMFVLICTALTTALSAAMASGGGLLLANGHTAHTIPPKDCLHLPKRGSAATVSAPASLPHGVALAARAVAIGVFSLTNVSLKSAAAVIAAGGVGNGVNEREAQRLLKCSTLQIWFGFLVIFFQQMSARNSAAVDVPLWKQFFAECKAEAVVKLARPISDDDDDDEAQSDDTKEEGPQDESFASCGMLLDSSVLIRKGKSFRDHAELDALRAWADVSPVFLTETIPRTRFRRAALLFKSHTPHVVSQAPGTTFLLLTLLQQFCDEWDETIRAIPLGAMSEAAQRYFLYRWETTERMGTAQGAKAKYDQLTEKERKLADLVVRYGDCLGDLLGESATHGYLLATVLGTMLCVTYLLPCSRVAPTLSRRLTSRGSAATPSAVASFGNGIPVRDRSAENVLMNEGAAKFKAWEAACACWVKQRPVEQCGEVEWRLRQFFPLGLLLQHLHLDPFIPTHLFHFSTQLCVGLSPKHHTESRERVALYALLSGLCDIQTALLMFHFAGKPPPPWDGWSSPPPTLPCAALAKFTTAVNDYAGKVESELVLDLTVAAADKATNNGTRLRSRPFNRHGKDEAANGGMPPTSAAYFAESIPLEGQLRGHRFCHIKCPDFTPLWTQYLLLDESQQQQAGGGGGVGEGLVAALAPATPSSSALSSPATPSTILATPMLISPCRLALELLAARYYHWAARFLRDLLLPPPPPPQPGQAAVREVDAQDTQGSVNLFLIPKRALSPPINVQVYLFETLVRRLKKWEQGAEAGAGGDGGVATTERAAFAGGAADPSSRIEILNGQFRWLRDLLPLLELASTYMATQTLLVPLMARLVGICEDAVVLLAATAACRDVSARKDEEVAEATDAASGKPPKITAVFVRSCFALAELYLIHVIMPCLRVLPPLPLVYDDMQRLFRILQTHGRTVRFGATHSTSEFLHFSSQWLYYLLPHSSFAQPAAAAVGAALLQQQDSSGDGDAMDADPFGSVDSTALPVRVPRHPHDLIHCKEQQALLQQSLKRLNARNVDYYRVLLRQVLYAEPLYLADRLFTQAVGYENSFLAIHTRLLLGLPAPILFFVFHYGLTLMRRFAASPNDKTTRVALIANFLATLWRDSAASAEGEGEGAGVGQLLLDAAEVALRNDTRHDMIFGVQLLKALLFQLTHRTLEHEAHFSELQLKTLMAPGPLTRFFGRGTMESFRVSRWSAWLEPASLAIGRRVLVEALQRPLSVPCDGHVLFADTSGAVGESGVDHCDATVPVGSWILLHLCRLQSRIYELQADLEGSMELVLCTSSKDFNIMNDLIFAMEEMLLLLPAPGAVDVAPLEALLAKAAMPHMALRLSMRLREAAKHGLLRQKQQGSDASDELPAKKESGAFLMQDPLVAASLAFVAPMEASPLRSPAEYGECERDGPWGWLTRRIESVSSAFSFTFLRRLSTFTAAHFVFDEKPYDAALVEWRACIACATAAVDVGCATSRTVGTGGGVPSILPLSPSLCEVSLRWLRPLNKQIEAEKEAHRRLYYNEDRVLARRELFEALRSRVLLPPDLKEEEEDNTADDALLCVVCCCLLPRALLSLEETLFVRNFFIWLLREARAYDTREERRRSLKAGVGAARWRSCYARAVDMALTLITEACTFFVGLTDAESKRLGYLINHLLGALDSAAMPPLPTAVQCALAAADTARALSTAVTTTTVASGAAVAGGANEKGLGGGGGGGQREGDAASAKLWDTCLNPAPCSLYSIMVGSRAPKAIADSSLADPPSTASSAPPVSSNGSGSGGGSGSVEPRSWLTTACKAYPLQCEAYLCRTLVQFLGNFTDVPSHVHRNLFLVLERLDKQKFPSTQCGTELLLRTIIPHAEQSKPNFASATAVLKALRENLRSKRAILTPVQVFLADYHLRPTQIRQPNSSDTMSPHEAAREWLYVWRLREGYMQELLVEELLALDRQVGSSPTEDALLDADDGGGTKTDEASAAGDDKDCTGAEYTPGDGDEHAAGSSAGSFGANDATLLLAPSSSGFSSSASPTQASEDDEEERGVRGGDSVSGDEGEPPVSGGVPPSQRGRGGMEKEASRSSTAGDNEKATANGGSSASVASSVSTSITTSSSSSLVFKDYGEGRGVASRKRPREMQRNNDDESVSPRDSAGCPSVAQEVCLDLLIPEPLQRPRTVANFVYMSTGDLPPEDLFRALRLDPASDLAFATAADARAAGLKPFREMSVVRIDRDTLVEIGGSTSKSIFKGGFIPDEPLDTASMLQHKAGTVLCGNAGLPNTHCSRYYILLADPSCDEEAKELASYLPLGVVVGNGLEALRAACSKAVVQPRTLAPLKKVEFRGCQIDYDYRALLMPPAAAVGGEEGGYGRDFPCASLGGRGAAGATRKRVAGSVRQREEYENGGAASSAIAGVQGDGSQGGEETHQGFFRFGVTYPRVGGSRGERVTEAEGGDRPAKRRRAEVDVAVYADDQLLALAEGSVADASGKPPPSFDFFKVQESVFMHDLERINEAQQSRHRHHTMRAGRKAKFTVSSSHGRERQAKGDRAAGGGSAALQGGAARPRKIRRRRY